MKDFRDKVAVITGGASGIGLALVNRCLKEGMKVVIADLDRMALKKLGKTFAGNTNVVTKLVDVSDLTQVTTFANDTFETMKHVDLLFNNAGVGTGGPNLWTTHINDWNWVLGVNLYGQIHMINSFLPKMIAQVTPGYIVNTASIAGVMANTFNPVYGVSKHASVAFSECLFYELQRSAPNIKISVLCPGFIKTRIMESERVRPERFTVQTESAYAFTPEMMQFIAKFGQCVQEGMPPEEVANIVFDAIQSERFYIFPNPEYISSFKSRFDSLTEQSNPKIAFNTFEDLPQKPWI